MSTRYVCDWCGSEFDDRKHVASVDVTIGGVNEALHICGQCAPDHLKQHYPEDPKLRADGGRRRGGWNRGRPDRPHPESVRQLTGVAGQCRNGIDGCPGPDSGGMPCPACFFERDDPDGQDRELIADGGAIDHDFEESERSTRDILQEKLADVQTEPMAGGVAIDLVTRQPVFVRRVVAEDLVAYYEAEDFDLNSYKTHPYLPVSIDDAVYECVYIAGDPERAHKPGKTYDFPRGRLMTVPVQEAWTGGEQS